MKRTAYGFRNQRYFELRLYALHDCHITRNVGWTRRMKAKVVLPNDYHSQPTLMGRADRCIIWRELTFHSFCIGKSRASDTECGKAHTSLCYTKNYKP